MKKAALLLILLISGMIFPLLANRSFAVGVWPSPTDYSMNFDNFAIGAMNPFPWTLTTSTSGCTGDCINPSVTGAVNNTEYQSAPYSYQTKLFLETSGSGTYGPYTISGYIKGNFNATNTFVNASVYTMGLSFGINGADFGAQLYLNDSVASGQASTTSASSWAQLSKSIAATAGDLVSVFLKFNMTLSSSTYGSAQTIGYHVFFDSFSILYAAAYSSSQGTVPAGDGKIALYNDSSAGPYWFDPSGYTGSSLTIDYASSTNSSSSWQNAPSSGLSLAQAYVPALTGASLVTFYLGGSSGFEYSRTLIPDGNAANFYLDNPASVLPYTVSIIGPAGNASSNFPSGSDIFIQQAGHNITSGYLGSSQNFLAYLVPGTYTVVLENDGSINTQTAIFPDTSGANVQISVFGAKITYSSGIVTAQAFGASWNSTLNGLVITYQDSSNSSTWFGANIYVTNSSGTFEVGEVYKNLTPGNPCTGSTACQTYSQTVVANTVNLNVNISDMISVQAFSSSNYYGDNQSLGTITVPLATCSYCIFGSAPDFPTDIMGFNILLPNISWLNLIAFFVMVFTAAGFGYVASRFGFLVVCIEGIFFGMIDWLNLPAAIITTLPLMAITSLLTYFEKGR